MKVMLSFIFAFTASLYTILIIINPILGYPPKHCNYIVPIKNVPGSYGCSQYPHPITYKK
jgi:hypothetical protein